VGEGRERGGGVVGGGRRGRDWGEERWEGASALRRVLQAPRGGEDREPLLGWRVCWQTSRPQVHLLAVTLYPPLIATIHPPPIATTQPPLIATTHPLLKVPPPTLYPLALSLCTPSSLSLYCVLSMSLYPPPGAGGLRASVAH